MITKLLLIGCGDIAIRLSRELNKQSATFANAFEFYGVRRDIDQLPDHIHGMAHDLNHAANFSACLLEQQSTFDYVVITLVPNERSDAGYRQAYVENLNAIILALEALPTPPKHIFFVSSTSVYGQDNEEVVDENSETKPTHFSGQRVLQGEKRLAESSIPATVIRFSGIYGPNRLRVIGQVKNGDWSVNDDEESGYSNRIHADDCAGVLAHFIRKKIENTSIASCYLASDCEPVRLNTVKRWIAGQLQLSPPMAVSNSDKNKEKKKPTMRRNSKRCSNKKLIESGYQFKYPTFREGYGEVLKQIQE